MVKMANFSTTIIITIAHKIILLILVHKIILINSQNYVINKTVILHDCPNLIQALLLKAISRNEVCVCSVT